ncbi:MAG: four helix bundle protein [Proteobacteria bacterium]|nr:four helix bundle protein [Pseudomonadota bacterium]
MKAKDLSVYIYKITNTGNFGKDYSLRDQIRRADVKKYQGCCQI